MQPNRDTKAELNRRSQACEVLTDTGISRRVKWSEQPVTLRLTLAPEASAPRGGPPPFRVRSEKLPSARNPISGHYFDRASDGRVLILAGRAASTGANRSSIWVSLPVFLLGRSLRTATSVYLSTPMLGKWSPVRELHPPERFCRPSPRLLGQRDLKNGECGVRNAEC